MNTLRGLIEAADKITNPYDFEALAADTIKAAVAGEITAPEAMAVGALAILRADAHQNAQATA